MALCRCDSCGVQRNRTRRNYVRSVDPIGYPDTAVICGRPNCTNPARVWLDNNEFTDYQNGVKIFSGSTNVAKFCVA